MFISIGGCERVDHSGCSTTTVQVGDVCCQPNPDHSSLRFQGEVSYEKCCLLRATAKSTMNAVVAHKNQSQRGLFLTCLIWPVRPMTNSGMQRRQIKKPTMERPVKPRAQLRDTQLNGLRSWIASPSKK